MRLIYDTEVDALTVVVTREAVERTEDAGHGRFIDFDDEGNVVALEILDASQGFDLFDLMERYHLEPVLDALAEHFKTAQNLLGEGSDLREALTR
ncbi:MAG: DUF2283 domain-containing protein [Gaiellaceae bacterium]